MYLNILKRDLKRNRTMNIILLLFVILAAMFVASGLNNVVTILNGTDYLPSREMEASGNFWRIQHPFQISGRNIASGAPMMM